MDILQSILGGLWETSGLAGLAAEPLKLVMMLISFVFMYLAIV